MKHTHYWKIGLGILGFMGLLLALTVVTWAAESEDLDPPHLVSLDFAPKTVDTSDADQVITFTARITDDLSGVDYVYMHFHSPSEKQYHYLWPNLRSGDALDGMYTDSIVLPRYSETGVWTVSSVALKDRVTNGRWLDETDLITMSFPTQFTVTGTISDVTPPQLVSFDFGPKTVDTSGTALLPRTITFTAHITDDLSGVSVNDVAISLISPSSEQRHYIGSSFPDTGNILDDIHRSSIVLPPYSETGVWKVEKIRIQDKVTNERDLYETDLTDLGFPTHFTVTAPISDTAPPHLATFDFEPKVVDTARTSETITFTARITDNLAGVNYWYFRYYSPSGQYMPSMYQTSVISGGPHDRTYVESVILPQYSEMGIWTLSHIGMYDLADNRAWLGLEDVMALGFPTDTIQFMNGTPITGGVQSTLIYPSPDGLTTTLDIPAGAVTDTTYLAYNTINEVTDIPQGHTFAGRAFSLDAYRDMALLSDFHFVRPPTVTLAYDGAVVSGTRESNLLLACWNGDTWVDIANSCPGAEYVRQPEQDQISVPICHLSKFALLSREESGPHTVYIPLVLRNRRVE